MSTAWKPIDVGGFRLYKVVVFFPATDLIAASRKHVISAGRTPTDAAQHVLETYKDMPNFEDIHAKGYPLNVLQPASWWDDEVPEPNDPRFGKWQ
jgi:hypothetical protein